MNNSNSSNNKLTLQNYFNDELNMSKEQKALSLRNEIKEYFEKNGYTFITDINTITSKSIPFEYVCNCKEHMKKTFRDMCRRGCRNCNSIRSKEIPTDYSICPKNNLNEIWKAIKGGFISNLGNAINYDGKEMSLDETGRYTIGGEHQYATIFMANAFKIEGYEKLGGQKNKFIVIKKTKNLKPTLDDIYVGTRNEIGAENGKKSRKSEEFKEARNRDIIEHTLKYKHKKLNEFPDYIFFEDGNIYNNQKSYGKFFLTFSTNTSEKSKQYFQICRSDKTYKVHKLMCMAFHPIEGKENYDDYNDLQVNHIDGNTLNNHKDNLEWTSNSENIKHAYENGHNKKVRNVLQFENIDGELGQQIDEYKSIAEASRKTNIPEHEIRHLCNGEGHKKNKKYLWKFKNEEETKLYSEKYRSSTKKSNKKIIQESQLLDIESDDEKE